MLTAILKAVKMLLSCCPKNSKDVAVLAALKAVQDAEKNHLHKDQVQRLISITEAYPDYALDMGLITKSQYNKINKIVPICELAVKLCGNSSFAFSVSHPLLIPPSLAELSPVKCFFSRCSICF
jgi:hypothetical protein